MEFKQLNLMTAWVIAMALVLALGLAWLRSARESRRPGAALQNPKGLAWGGRPTKKKEPAMDRRDFLKLAGISLVFVSGLDNLAAAAEKTAGALKPANKPVAGDFFFVQMSDTHWGFNDPKVNPDFAGTQKKGRGPGERPANSSGFHRLHRGSDPHGK